jgi:TorA maturation chaperone TorD
MSAGPDAAAGTFEEVDRARADLYALLARLYYAAPDAMLLELIAHESQAEGAVLAAAWNALAAAAATADAAAVRQEYDDVFIGTGKAEITPYATYYLAQSGREKILVQLRQELAALGLARTEAAREPEDHIAGLFDVMRHLVLADSSDAAMHHQRQFFDRFVGPFYARFCEAVVKSERAEFYKPVAGLTQVFLDIELEALKV